MRWPAIAWALLVAEEARADLLCVDCQSKLGLAAKELNYSAYHEILDESRWDAQRMMRTYFHHWWHPGTPLGVGCAELEHMGIGDSEQGKALCAVDELLAAPCRVVSVGSNGDAAFEADVHERAPHCRIDTYDGTLTEQKRSQIPSYVQFHDQNWDVRSVEQFTPLAQQQQNVSGAPSTGGHSRGGGGGGGGHVINLLKIDCEGCEMVALLPFLARVPVRQIVMEIHGCLIVKSVSIRQRNGLAAHPARPVHILDAMHAFMWGVYELGYRIYAAEPNLMYSDGTCIEFSFLKVRSHVDVPRYMHMHMHMQSRNRSASEHVGTHIT